MLTRGDKERVTVLKNISGDSSLTRTAAAHSAMCVVWDKITELTEGLPDPTPETSDIWLSLLLLKADQSLEALDTAIAAFTLLQWND